MSARVYFATTNPHKVRQARAVLGKWGVEVRWLRRSYDESSDDSIYEIARKAVASLAEKEKKPVVVEDTGVFFKAYKNFPGAFPKFVFNSIGYEGIFRLLRGKSKEAEFVSAVGYCEPGKKAILFTGTMRGRVQLKAVFRNKDVLPYERIFIPEGKREVLASLSQQEKLALLHRAKAFEKLGRHLRGKAGRK